MTVISSRFFPFLGVIISLMASMAVAANPPKLIMQEVATFQQTDRMLHAGAIVCGSQGGSRLYVAVSSKLRQPGKKTNEFGLGIMAVDPKQPDKVKQIFWRDVKPPDLADPYPVKGLVRKSDGTFILIAKADGTATSALWIDQNGKVLAERPLFKGNPDAIIEKCLLTNKDDVLLIGFNNIGPVAVLIHKDFKLAWRRMPHLKKYKMAQFWDGIYDSRRSEFVLAGTGSPSGVPPLNHPSDVVIARIDYDGTLRQTAALPGRRPAIAQLDTDTFVLLRDTSLGHTSHFELCTMDWQLKPSKAKAAFDVPKAMLPYVYHYSLSVLKEHFIAVAGWQEHFELYLNIYATNFEPIEQKIIHRVGFGHQFVPIINCADQFFMATTKMNNPPQDRTKPMSNHIIIESLEVSK